MATPLKQRIFIWIITATMIVGTLGVYFLVIIQNNNQQNDLTAQQELIDQLQCDPVTPPADAAYVKPEAITFDKATLTELRSEDVTVGTGTAITTEDACVTVHYQGNVADGTVFDGSYDKTPIAFRLDGVIAGWQQGMQGMKEGGRRVLYIPSDLAYGETGQPPSIGANEPLVFTIDLIDVKD